MLTNIWRQFGVFCLVSFLVPFANATSVTIDNPGFENSWTGWSVSGSAAISTSDFYDGSHSAKITGSSGVFSQTLGIAANTSYSLSTYILGAGKITATVNGTTYTKSASTSSWQKVTLSFSSGTATSVTISGIYNGNTGRFDAFTLDSTDTSSSSVSSSVSSSSSVPSVVLSNAGFESDWSGWTQAGSAAISTSDYYEGSKSAKITGSSGVFSQTLSILANTNYTLSAYVLGDGKITAQAGGNTYSNTASNSSWQQVSVTFNSGAETSVTISGGYNGSTGRFDAFALNADAASSSSVASSTSSATSSSSSATGSATYPADIGGGLALWKLTVPTSASGNSNKADEIKQPTLATYSSAYFSLNTAKTAMVFTDIFGGARTSTGTAYARSELRERTASGTDAAWSCTADARQMTIRQRITKSPAHKPEMSVGQIHDASNDNLEIRYIGPEDANGVGTGNGLTDTGTIEAHWNNDSSYNILDSAYKIGDMMNITITTDGSGYQTVSYSNERTGVSTSKTVAFSGVSGSCFFKAGNYHQACTVTDIYGNTNVSCSSKAWVSNRWETDPYGTSVLEIYALSLQ